MQSSLPRRNLKINSFLWLLVESEQSVEKMINTGKRTDHLVVERVILSRSRI